MNHISLIKKTAFVLVVFALILSACAPAATPTAPAAAEPQTIEVTKIVAGTPVVQQVVVTATPPPAAPKPKGEILIWGWPSADKAFEVIHQGV